MTAAFAGLRLGEAAGVQVGDIDFLRRTLDKRRQVQRAGVGTVESARPSTAVSGSCTSPTGCSSCCPSTSGSTDLARTRLAGSSRPRQEYRRIRTPLGTSGARPAGAPRSPRFTLHDLRHFYASGLIAAGCDVVTVQRALGHAKATTTLNTYAHLWPTAEDRTRKAANGLFAAATADPMTAQRRPNDGPTASDLRR